MTLSIIIVNYKSGDLVLACIASIFKETLAISFEIIVVDNNSGDRSEALILQAYPNVKWVQTGYNAGFARANNVGIALSEGNYVLLLNADTIILNNALDKTIALFEKDDAVACGVQLLNTDYTHQISGAHFVKGGLNFLLPLPYLGRLVRYLGYRFNARVPSVTEVGKRIEVDWIVGAFLVVKRPVIAQAGLLDGDFFMYAEEIEWCSRLRKQGKLVLYSDPEVIHIGGGTSGDFYNTEESDNSKNLWNRKGRQVMLSMFVRIRKQYGIGWFLLMLAAFVVDIPVFFFCLVIAKIVKARPRYSWQDFKEFCRNVWCLLLFLPRIISGRSFFYKV